LDYGDAVWVSGDGRGEIPIVSPGVLEGREEKGIGFSGVVELYPK